MAFRTLVLGFIALSLTACNMSGSGQKGPFKSGSNVTVVQLNNQASPISSSAESTQVNGSQGDYSAQPIQWDGWTEVSISGQYFDEFSGTDSSASLALDAITTKNKRYDTANLHVYSHLAAARIRQRVADDQTLTNAWKNTQSEMKRLFDLKKVSTDINKGVEQLSLLNGSGSYRKDNANLLLFTGSFLATGGDAATLTSLANDFADDGEINGAGAGAFNEIAIKASTDGLLNSLSQNLRNNGAGNPPNSGDMSKLPKWVVEDAGPTDETAPVISLLGENPVELDVGTAYEDASATATDDVDEVVTVTVVENSDVIDTSVAGTHTVNYSATDAAGNSSTATRTVNVNAVVDTTVPVITVTGSNPTIIVVGTSYVDEGATATDDVDENVAANAINGSDVINTSDPATFTVTYSATDIAGNTSTATRIVEVVEAPDTEAPVLTLLGDNPDSVEVSTGEVPVPYQDPSYDVSDNRDEVVNVVVDGLELIDTSNKDGSYILTYTATDVAGNTTIVERTVNIVDTTAPVITLAGNNTHEVFVDNGEVPEPYQDLGATVSDNYDNGLGYTVDLTVVDTGKVGPYTLVYNATDSSGNDAIRVERVVNVVEAPNVAPTVDAGADTSVQVNSAVTLTGIGEDTDGTITYSWTENGVEISTTASFNYTPTTEGVHTLTLTVTDNDSATASDDIVVTVTLPAPYQIVFVSDITEVPRNLDADLFAQGFTLPSPLTIVSIIDGNGNSVDEELVFDPSVVDLTTPGVYPLVFSVTDPFGRLVTKTLTVRVVNHEPIATSSSTTVDEDSSNNPITLIARDTDQGDTLTYTFTQPTNGTVTGTAPNVTYTPDADFAGTDSFTFTVSDGFAQSTGTITITVTDIPEPDTTAPVITLIGNAAINVVEGGTYTEQGATASDDRDGDISANVVIAGDTVNTNSEPGTAFIVTYNVSDAAGNAAAQVTRIVTITQAPDTTVPVITLIGSASESVVEGGTYTEQGATASDDRDGDISTNVVIAGDTVNTNSEPGTAFIVTYNVSDAAGNAAAQVTRTVTITQAPDTTVPVITLIGSASESVVEGGTYTEQGATASDDRDGDISTNVVIAGDTVNTNSEPGTVFIVTYNVSDAAGNAAAQVTRTVTITQAPDTTVPVITLIGGASESVVEGGTYTEQGATASDDRDGDISANVVIAGDTVNTNSEPGTAFIVTYNVLDATGNAATQVTRTVTITANDHTIPDLSVAEIQEYLATINNARSVARSCGVYGDFPAVEPVTWSDKLYRAAFEHSHDMSESNTFSHDGSGTIFDWTGFALNVQSSVGDRIENYEYDWLRYSENIAAGTVMDTPQEAIDGWLTSDGHCKNIMDPNVTEVGMATSANQNADFVNYWTQNFGRPRNPEPPVFDNSVSGRVTSTAGVELLGVSVKVLQNGNEIVPSSTTTIANGIFNLNLPPETEFTLTFTANGYANQVLPVKTPTIGRINLDVTMIPRGVSQAVENVPSVSLTGTDGAKVSLSPQFVDSQGNSVDASNGISLTITPVDVSTPVGIAAFPGDFAGIAQGEVTPTPIISYGTVEYQFTRDSDGAVLQLANGQIADIEIPIYTTTHQDGTAIAFDDTIQLWSLNEDTGIWTQEGTGTVVASSASPTGFALSANVSHFTWWNADVSMDQQAQVIINVNAPESGSALIKTRTTANIPWGFNSSDTVVSIGGSTGALAIPSDVEVCFWAEINFTNGNSATTAESCITAVAGSSTDVTLEIQGGLLNIVASNVSVSTHILNTLYAPQIKIQPTTSESNVVYTIASGTLPVGVNLTPVNNTTAVISGVPTEAGSFSFEVKGINIDGEESIVAINYTVTDGDITTWTFGPNGNENKVLKISSANKLRVTVVGQREYGESLTILDKNGNTINVPNSSNDIGVFYNADFIILGDLISISYLGNSPSDITVAISIPQKPIITLLGDSTVIVANGENYIDAGATASDDQDGDITANIVVTDLPVNTSVGGSYTITFNVIDSDGNSADEVTRTVDVGFDRLELLGAYTTTGDSSQVVLSPDENTAYVYQGSITEILNVSNPELPVLLGSFAGGQHAVLSPDGTKLYHGTGGLKVVDVTDPTNPVNKGSWSTFYSKDIAISPDGTKVYMVRHTFLHVIDVTDDDNPTVVGQFSPASYYYVDKLALSPDGTKAYLSFNNASNQKDYLYAVDVSDPTSPLFLDWKQESYIGNVYVSADGLKIHLVRRGGTFGDGEIETFDVSDPSNLSYQTSIGDLPTDNLVLSSDNIRSYSSNGTNGGNGHVFISSDIKSNATAYSGLSAEELGRIDVGASIQDIALSEDSSIAYLATGQNGLQIINLRGAPLFIKASNVNVVAYINGEVEDVNIQSVSAQSTVSYTIISGILPAGLTLTSTGDTTAVISGTPVETGAFDVTVQGINADGEIASIQLQFNVGETQPPVLTDQYFFEFSNDIFVNYNDYNTGGAVVSWSLLGQCGSTDWVDLDSATGEIVATQLGPDNFYCSGTIRAENAGGFSEADITIEIAFDEGGEVGIIE